MRTLARLQGSILLLGRYENEQVVYDQIWAYDLTPQEAVEVIAEMQYDPKPTGVRIMTPSRRQFKK